MSEKVELELLRRLEAITVEREEALSDIETLKLHVDTLRDAAQSAASEVMRLRAERDALAGEASSIEQNVGALLDLYHAWMIESKHQEKLAWERAAEKDRAYGEALAELDEARDLLRAVAAACRGLGPRTDAVMSVVGNALSERDEARAEVERLRLGNDMACENTPTAGCECPGCETARSRAENGEAGW